jgi:hypothetical protein
VAQFTSTLTQGYFAPRMRRLGVRQTEAHCGRNAPGVAAAIGAARLGARTLLLEHMGFLGGAATARNVLTYCGLFTLGETPKQAVRGMADDVLDGLRRLNAVPQKP